MGFSISGATAVIFIGLLVSTATLYPAVDRYTERRSDAMTGDRERSLTQQNTGIATVNATYNVSADRLNITIRNTGSNTLAVSKTDLLVDGEYVPPSTVNTTVSDDADTDIWAPGETLTVMQTRASTPNRTKVVTGPGLSVTTTVEAS